ncbi:MAG: hypothetical protein A2V65_09240 [Deltaproteobacteria bacterium RBG_13_49_15]|nr:MAG: hypothetical protein A2V65_09240 [Deltaproteobacteria bacterium RBG_13_49_15]
MKILFQKTKELVEKGETYSIGFWAFVLNLLAVAFLRAFFEGLLERPHLIGLSRTPSISGAAFFRHFPLFFLLSFIIILLILLLFTGEKADRIAIISLFVFPIILIPPIADIVFTWGQGDRLYYISSSHEYSLLMLGFFIPGNRVPGASYGLRVEIFLLLVLMGAYVLIKTKNPLKALGAILLTFGILGSLGSIPFIVTAVANAVLNIFGKDQLTAQYIFKGSHCLIADRGHRIEAILFLLLAVAGSVFVRIWKPHLVSAIIKDFRWSRFLHYLFLTLFGIAVGYVRVGIPFFDVLQPINYVALLVCLIAMLSVFESAVLLNDMYDMESDCINNPHRPLVKGKISQAENRGALSFFLIIAIVSSSILGLHQQILIVTMWVAAFFYSAQPFQFKKRLPLNLLVIGLESFLCFIYGFSLFGQIYTPQILPWEAAVTIFIYSFFCASIKDIKDSDGDQRCGARTLITVFGPVIGQKLIGAFILVSFVLSPVMLGIKILIPLGVLFGVYCFVAAHKGILTEKKVFLPYFLFVGLLGAVYLVNVSTLPIEQNPLRMNEETLKESLQFPIGD